MLRLISSFFVLLLGAAASPARGARPRGSLRPRRRQPTDDDGAAARAFEAVERPRARARRLRWRWRGSVEFVHDTHTVQVPGTWMLDDSPFHHGKSDPAAIEAPPLPHLTNDSAAWAARMRRVLSLQEPGTRLRIGDVDANGWQTLEVAIPTRPPAIVQVDRDALRSLFNSAVTVRLKIE